MFYFRINKLKIIDNRESGFLFFTRDRAEVKLLSFITTGNTDLPELANLMSAKSDEEKRKIIKETVKRCISSRTFVEIQNVRDNQTLTFGDTGYVLYQSEAIPDDFNWIFLAIESDKETRDFGQFLENIVEDEDFSIFSKDLLDILSETAANNPAYAAGLAIAKFVTGILIGLLKNDKDDLIGVLYTSLNRREHYPHSDRKKDNVPDITHNMLMDYTIFGYEAGTKKEN